MLDGHPIGWGLGRFLFELLVFEHLGERRVSNPDPNPNLNPNPNPNPNPGERRVFDEARPRAALRALRDFDTTLADQWASWLDSPGSVTLSLTLTPTLTLALTLTLTLTLTLILTLTLTLTLTLNQVDAYELTLSSFDGDLASEPVGARKLPLTLALTLTLTLTLTLILTPTPTPTPTPTRRAKPAPCNRGRLPAAAVTLAPRCTERTARWLHTVRRSIRAAEGGWS